MSAFGFRSALLLLAVMVMSVPMVMPLGADNKESFQRLEIVANTHQLIKLKGYDSTGDKLHLTMAPTMIENKQVRSIDIYILDERNAKNFAMVKKADPKSVSMYYAQNISSRYEKEYKSLDELQLYLVLDNPLRNPLTDDKDPINSTAVYRVDYRVEDAPEGSTVPWALFIMALLALAIAAAIIAAIVLFRRGKRDRKSFFVKGSFLYYALQGPDGNTFYFGPDQYNRMYAAGSLAGFQFLGYTREIGGEIYNENGTIVTPAPASPASSYPAGTSSTLDQPAPQPVVLQAPAPVDAQAALQAVAPTQTLAQAAIPIEPSPVMDQALGMDVISSPRS